VEITKGWLIYPKQGGSEDMAKRKRQKISQSRARYEQNHPVISFRASKEVRDRIKAVQEAEGKSIGDIVKVGLGILEAKVRAEKDIRASAFAKGFKRASDFYMVSYPCAKCGETMRVTTDEEKEDIKAYMAEQGWGHSECVKGES
jgi:hypothetical protein